jgi:hypothetical protein
VEAADAAAVHDGPLEVIQPEAEQFAQPGAGEEGSHVQVMEPRALLGDVEERPRVRVRERFDRLVLRGAEQGADLVAEELAVDRVAGSRWRDTARSRRREKSR